MLNEALAQGRLTAQEHSERLDAIYAAKTHGDLVPVLEDLPAQPHSAVPAPIQAERARELAREATTMMLEGAPSLLNEAPAFLARHDACVDLGALDEAREAIAQGIPRLVTRVHGLAGTPYGRGFLTQIASNAGLVTAAEGYGLLPKQLAALVKG